MAMPCGYPRLRLVPSDAAEPRVGAVGDDHVARLAPRSSAPSRCTTAPVTQAVARRGARPPRCPATTWRRPRPRSRPRTCRGRDGGRRSRATGTPGASGHVISRVLAVGDRPQALVAVEVLEPLREAHLVELVHRSRGEPVAARLLAGERLLLDDQDVVAGPSQPVGRPLILRAHRRRPARRTDASSWFLATPSPSRAGNCARGREVARC